MPNTQLWMEALLSVSGVEGFSFRPRRSSRWSFKSNLNYTQKLLEFPSLIIRLELKWLSGVLFRDEKIAKQKPAVGGERREEKWSFEGGSARFLFDHPTRPPPKQTPISNNMRNASNWAASPLKISIILITIKDYCLYRKSSRVLKRLLFLFPFAISSFSSLPFALPEPVQWIGRGLLLLLVV